MSPARSLAVARANLLVELRDPVVHLLMVVIPLVLIPFAMPLAKAQLIAQGHLHATGVEQALPGFAVLFSFLSVQQVIQSFFHEYEWGTWDRLRASAASTADVLLGKVTVAFVFQGVQLGLVIGAGALLFGYRPTGSVLALALVLAVFSLSLCSFGVMVVALVDTADLALTISNLVGMLMAGLGGSIAPVDSFPHWAQRIAPASPAYWALDAVTRISLDGAGLPAVWHAIAVLLGFALACAAIAALRFRVDATKTGQA